MGTAFSCCRSRRGRYSYDDVERNVEEEEVWNVKIELGDGDLLSQNSKDGHSPGSVSDDDKYHLGGSNMFAIADHSEEEEEEEEAGEQSHADRSCVGEKDIDNSLAIECDLEPQDQEKNISSHTGHDDDDEYETSSIGSDDSGVNYDSEEEPSSQLEGSPGGAHPFVGVDVGEISKEKKESARKDFRSFPVIGGRVGQTM